MLPYLTALVEDAKIEPDLALTLNRLAKPVEYYGNGTQAFAGAIQQRTGIQPNVIDELIKQYEDDNPATPSDGTLEVLASIARRTLGDQSQTTRYLTAAHKHFKTVRDTTNEHRNYSGRTDARLNAHVRADDRDSRNALTAIVRATNPGDRRSLSEGIDALSRLDRMRG